MNNFRRVVIVALEDATVLNEIPVLQISADPNLERGDPLVPFLSALNNNSGNRGRFAHINLQIHVMLCVAYMLVASIKYRGQAKSNHRVLSAADLKPLSGCVLCGTPGLGRIQPTSAVTIPNRFIPIYRRVLYGLVHRIESDVSIRESDVLSTCQDETSAHRNVAMPASRRRARIIFKLAEIQECINEVSPTSSRERF